MDRYSYARSRVVQKIREWKTGDVTLTRSTPGSSAPETPWIPGAPTLDVYALDCRVDGVTGDYVNNATIVATDLVVIASPKATHTLSDGAEADGATVDIVPQMDDVLHIDGEQKTIKQITAIPASGAAALFHIFVAS